MQGAAENFERLKENETSQEQPGSNDLLSCPFCGSNKLTEHYYLQQSSDGEAWFVTCQDCEAQGPCKPSSTEAQKAWSKRGEELTDAERLDAFYARMKVILETISLADSAKCAIGGSYSSTR